MFLNPSERWFFQRTKQVLKDLCNGSPAACQDYQVFYRAFEMESFDCDTTQSFVGQLTYRKNPHLALIYKVSRYEDNVILQEYEILRQLDRFARRCPHFVRLYGLAETRGPIQLTPPKQLEAPKDVARRPILLLEHVHHMYDLEDLIDAQPPLQTLLSILAQTLLAIRILRAAEITHNDLHAKNVLVRRCAPKTTLTYVFRKESIVLPTYGNVPVLIDFGLGRSHLEGKTPPLLGSFRFTHYGYFADHFSPVVDYIRFLASVRSLCKTTYPRISKWCTTILKPVKGIVWSIGWDSFETLSATERVSELAAKRFKHVRLLEGDEWIDNLQLLIDRPLRAMPATDISVLDDFFKQWRRFEANIRSPAELNYLFRQLVLSIRRWRADYLQEDKTALAHICEDFSHAYERAIQFFCPEVNYEEMVCSLLLGASFLEGFYHSHIARLQTQCPPRGGPLFWSNPDQALWTSFMREFGAQLQPEADAPNKTCFLWI